MDGDIDVDDEIVDGDEEQGATRNGNSDRDDNLSDDQGIPISVVESGTNQEGAAGTSLAAGGPIIHGGGPLEFDRPSS